MIASALVMTLWISLLVGASVRIAAVGRRRPEPA